MATVDTNSLLSVCLQAAEAWNTAEPGSTQEYMAGETMAGVFQQLHRGLRAGGALPAAWCLAATPLAIGCSSGAGVL